MRKTSLLLVAAALAVAGCGSSDEGDAGPSSQPSGDEFNQPYTDVKAYPIFVSNELVVGENRFIVGLLNDQDAPLSDPAIELDIDFFDLEKSRTEPASSTEMRFVWLQKGSRGYYVGNATFDRAGRWGAEVHIRGAGLDENVKGSIEVSAESVTPAIGARPPAVDTPTATDAKAIAKISTDTHPDPRFYESSIAEALDAGRPSVVVFATPKFCQTVVCGPTLNTVKSVSGDFPDVTFVHVEPYVLEKIPELVPVDAMLEWKLPSEPWVFVMDAQGKVAAKFEGVIGAEELSDSLRSL